MEVVCGIFSDCIGDWSFANEDGADFVGASLVISCLWGGLILVLFPTA